MANNVKMKSGYIYNLLIVMLFFSIFLLPLSAQEDSDGLPSDIQWQHGPVNVQLDDGIAEIRVPMDFVFVNGDNARIIMDRTGNIRSDEEIGLLAPTNMEWFLLFEFREVGYVKDDDKDKLDADGILKDLQAANEEGNKIRKQKGMEALYITGWETKPVYNELTQNLEWATQYRTDNGNSGINHNIRLLGRRGYISATLVAGNDNYKHALEQVDEALKKFAYQPGHTYGEYKEGDKLAKYGLTALMVGGAAAVAAKSGLLKYLWKFLVIIVAALGGFFKKIFKRGE